MKPSYGTLYSYLGYQFQDEQLLTTALTHRSVGANNNERLEFLGDSLLSIIVAEALFQHFPKSSEGELSRFRAQIVKGETLAKVGMSVLHLSDYLHLGSGELKSGGFRRASILADAVEAMIAAIYLEAGFSICRERVLDWLKFAFDEIQANILPKDNKTALQELLQRQHERLPEYSIVKTEGEAHQQTFHVRCYIADLNLEALASGMNRRQAEQEAAGIILQKLKLKI